MELWRWSAIVSLILATTACGTSAPPAHLHIEGGDPLAGRRLIRGYGCGTCHAIDGVPGAHGTVGPRLTNFAQRTVLAGTLPNVPHNLVTWLMNPQALQPGAAMPNLGLTAVEAGDIASYLYTLGADNVTVYQERPTNAQYPWLSEAEAYRDAENRLLTDTTRVDRQHARIPISRAMELLAAQQEPGP